MSPRLVWNSVTCNMLQCKCIWKNRSTSSHRNKCCLKITYCCFFPVKCKWSHSRIEESVAEAQNVHRHGNKTNSQREQSWLRCQTRWERTQPREPRHRDARPQPPVAACCSWLQGPGSACSPEDLRKYKREEADVSRKILYPVLNNERYPVQLACLEQSAKCRQLFGCVRAQKPPDRLAE